MATRQEDARALGKIDLTVRSEHNQISSYVLDGVGTASLAILLARAIGAADGWTLMAAIQRLGTAFRAGHPIAGGGTRHTAFGVWAARCTLLFCAWGTRLATLLCALRVAALHVTCLLAKLACFVAVARLSARVLAVRKITSALLLTRRMLLADYPVPLRVTWTTFEALGGAGVATGL